MSAGASAAIGSRGRACSCSRGSRAAISPSSACRCFPCSLICASAACWNADDRARPHRLDRHGQVDRRGDVRRGRRAGVRRRRRGAPAAGAGRRAGRGDRGGISRHHRPRRGRSHRACRAGACRAGRRCGGWRRWSIRRWRGARAISSRAHRDRAAGRARHSLAVRGGRRGAGRQDRGGLRAGRRSSARGCSRGRE